MPYTRARLSPGEAAVCRFPSLAVAAGSAAVGAIDGSPRAKPMSTMLALIVVGKTMAGDGPRGGARGGTIFRQLYRGSIMNNMNGATALEVGLVDRKGLIVLAGTPCGYLSVDQVELFPPAGHGRVVVPWFVTRRMRCRHRSTVGVHAQGGGWRKGTGVVGINLGSGSLGGGQDGMQKGGFMEWGAKLNKNTDRDRDLHIHSLE